MEAISGALPGLAQIMWLNIILSGDNAVVIGLAAAGLPEAQRKRAVLFGIAAAAVLRIAFSVFASFLLALWWVDIAGGAALLWIASTFLHELFAGRARWPARWKAVGSARPWSPRCGRSSSPTSR